MNDLTGESVCEENLGRLFLRRKEAPAAMAHLLKAVELAKAVKSRERMIQTQSPLSLAYADLGLFKEGMHLIQKTIGLANELNSDIYTAEVYYSLGNIELKRGSEPLAVKYLSMAKSAAERTGNRRCLAWILTALGKSYLCSKNLGLGFSCSKQAEKIALQIGDKPLLKEAKLLRKQMEQKKFENT